MDDGTRTHDDRNHNPGLYQLSYTHHCPDNLHIKFVSALARLAGLEPATLGLEGRCSIRLSYRRPVLLNGYLKRRIAGVKLVGAEGFEPPTLCSQSRCATRLRHAPTSVGRYAPGNIIAAP